MEARITWRNAIVIKGKNLKEIKEKWNSMFDKKSDSGESFVEISSVEDSSTFENLKDNWNEIN